MGKYVCSICGYIYDEAKGIPSRYCTGHGLGGYPGGLGLSALWRNKG